MKSICSLVILAQIILFGFSCATKVPQINEALVEKSKNDPNVLTLDHKYFVITYDKTNNIAKWVKYTLTKANLNGPDSSRTISRL